MRFLSILVAALAVGAQARQFAKPEGPTSGDGEVIPNRFMVRLQLGTAKTDTEIKDYIINNLSAPEEKDPENLSSFDDIPLRRPSAAGKSTTYHKIPSRDVKFIHVINTPLFQGASIEVSSYTPRQIRAAIKRIPKSIGTPKPIRGFKPIIDFDEKERKTKGRVPPDFSAQSWHIKTGVDQLHKKGIYGKGIKIGVFDTGVDYMHPALGGGVGPGYKVEIARDYTPPWAFGQGLDCQGHGTHVAGTIAGNATGITDPKYKPDYEWWGVAPQATLGSYKTICYTSEDSLAAAIYDAQKDGMNIISGSFGFISPTIGGLVFEAFEAVEKAGVVVVIAAHNWGKAGVFTITNPGTSLKVLTVGSLDSGKGWLWRLVGPKGEKVAYLPVRAVEKQWSNESVGLVLAAPAPPSSRPDSGCAFLPTNATNKVVVFDAQKWPTCYDLCSGVPSVGGVGCVLIGSHQVNDYIPNEMAGVVDPGLPLATLVRSEGDKLIAAVKKQPNGLWNFTEERIVVDLPNGGRPSHFTSLGLTPDLDIKPDIAAFGGGIYSTIPSEGLTGTQPAYAYYSGTSMATPYVSGVVALYLQLHGKTSTPSAVRAAFRNTATPVSASVDAKKRNGQLAPVIQQGTGLINAPAAILSETVFEPSLFSLNDTVRLGNGEKTLKVVNNGKGRVTYRLRHVPALMVMGVSVNGSDHYDVLDQERFSDTYANVKFTPDTVTILPGRSATIKLKFTPPRGKGWPIYSGYVKITTSKKKEIYHVPYAGIVGDHSTRPIFSHYPAYDSALRISTGINKLFGTPLLSASLATGTRRLKVDLVPVGTDTPIGTVIANPLSFNNIIVDDMGIFTDVSRNQRGVLNGTETVTTTHTLMWSSGYVISPPLTIAETLSSNYTAILTERNVVVPPKGRYVVRFRACRPFGNVWEEGKYDVWDTQAFEYGDYFSGNEIFPEGPQETTTAAEGEEETGSATAGVDSLPIPTGGLLIE
ncbi:hypothetical protein HK097_008174 [Rhizophlyctis rosea]|uniref:Uncharacterized protein n=1 Tax=Rhizophlyctis rosea TaxID=64517 RepID=A0AAD5SCP4_9FUNG|nr:hypothetical protein HK097_008174 [Rhizophlyctis rosea]